MSKCIWKTKKTWSGNRLWGGLDGKGGRENDVHRWEWHDIWAGGVPQRGIPVALIHKQVLVDGKKT